MFEDQSFHRETPPRAPNVGLYVVLTLLALGVLWSNRHSVVDAFRPSRAEPRPVVARGDLAEDEKATIELFEQAQGSVVYVRVRKEVRDSFWLRPLEVREGTGSGFMWDEQGHVVTNLHVIRGADSYQVILADGSGWDATLVGDAADKDLAVLRISAPASLYRPIPIGTSKDLRVGQKVFAIGNPFGLDFTLTTGIVSALNREIESVSRQPIQGVIQTDAAINPGNSGGPLLDSAGRLIGVNTAIYSPSGSSAGIGFAVPVDIVNRVVPDLIAHGRVMRPGLGISIAPDYTARSRGIEGVIIMELSPGSAAAKAGLRGLQQDRNGRIWLGDVIVAVEQEPTPTHDALFNALEAYDVGQTVSITVLRDGKQEQVQVTLQAVPGG